MCEQTQANIRGVNQSNDFMQAKLAAGEVSNSEKRRDLHITRTGLKMLAAQANAMVESHQGVNWYPQYEEIEKRLRSIKLILDAEVLIVEEKINSL